MDFYTFFPNILNMSLTASVAIVFVMLLRLLLKKAPKVISYALWGVVLFRLLCPVSFESEISLFGLFETPTVDATDRTSMVEYIPSNIVHTENPEVVLPVPGVGDVITEALPKGEEQLRADPLEGPIFIATYVWWGGILVMAIYGFLTWLQLRRRLVTASPLRENIYLADDIDSPFVMGLIHPKIYLPSEMDQREQSYIILHEQHHIRRLDHIVKALAFVALCIHWFNPLVWVAFILSGKDMEMSCDEAVVRKLGTEIRADYTASLLSLATGKRIIAGMPLAFGEGNTKGRIKNLANWKKPAFWVVLVAVVACITLTIGLLTNPPAEREFPINGENVSDLDTDRLLEKIADAENLEDTSMLCVNADNFDLMFTPEFDWANDGAIRFFYTKNQKTYSAQIRMFHDENKYFITDRSDWIEQERIFKLKYYLDALKYIPQEEVRQLSHDADGYSVMQVDYGVPEDFDRVVTYSSQGTMELDGWYIHLIVQPLHELEDGSYNGSGDEVIHLFYGHQDLVMLENNSVTKWFDYIDNPAEMGDELTTEIPEFPSVTFTYNRAQIIASKPFDNSELTGHVIMIGGMPIWNAYFTDLTGDGYPDICATYSYGSGIIDTRIVIHDYANGASYELSDRGYHDFYLRLNEDDGGLYVEKRVYPNGELVSSGRLVYKDGCITIDPSLDIGASSLQEKYPEYFGLDTSNGLDVYVWQMAQNSYSFGVLPHEDTPRDWISAELMNLRGTDAQEMRFILKSYGLEESGIYIIPWQNPYSSYIADIWIIEDNVSQEDKQKKYIEQIRNMLFPSEEVAAPVETEPTESPVDYGQYISSPEMAFSGLEADGIKIDENWIEVQHDGAILEYHMTYDSPAIILEFGLIRDDGLEIKATVEDGVGIDSLENIPAGHYQLFVRNVGYVNDLPGKTVKGGAVNCTLYGGTTVDMPLDPDKTFVDLTQGEVKIKAEDIGSYIFYTNSMKIVVTVKGGNTDSGIVNLHPSESTELFVGTHELRGEKQCVFSGLTSARYYLMSTENLNGCELTVSGEQSFIDKLFG